jgi:hypothetical protein
VSSREECVEVNSTTYTMRDILLATISICWKCHPLFKRFKYDNLTFILTVHFFSWVNFGCKARVIYRTLARVMCFEGHWTAKCNSIFSDLTAHRRRLASTLQTACAVHFHASSIPVHFLSTSSNPAQSQSTVTVCAVQCCSNLAQSQSTVTVCTVQCCSNPAQSQFTVTVCTVQCCSKPAQSVHCYSLYSTVLQ